MAKHDLKAQEIQVEFLNNLMQMFITSRVAIKMASSDIDLSDPLSLITLEVLQEYVGGGEPLISLWDGGSTPLNYYRSHLIDGVEYLFRSLVSDNTSEPTLNTTPAPAWSQVIENGSPAVGYQDSWDAVTSFNNGVIVEFFSSGQNRLYRSLQGSNLNNNPSSSPLYWEEIGIMRGEYPDDQPYDEGDVALNPGDNILYQSNVSDNSFALDYELPGGTWQLIGGGVSEIPNIQDVLTSGFETDKSIQFRKDIDPEMYQLSIDWTGISFVDAGGTGPSITAIAQNILLLGVPGLSGVSKIQTYSEVKINPAIEDDEAVNLSQANALYSKVSQVYTQSDLVEEHEGSYYLSVSIPSGKVPVAIQRVQSGQTYYLPVNINAGILGGFSNNSTQTITIYFI